MNRVPYSALRAGLALAVTLAAGACASAAEPKPEPERGPAVIRETFEDGEGSPIERALLPHPDREGSRVEVLWVPPADGATGPALIYVHGWQPERQGAEAFIGPGVLKYMASRGFLAAAISQPGFGKSDGPPDYCGPATQRALEAAIDYLRGLESSDGRVVLYGFSRGAFVSGMVATRVRDLTGVVLIAGAYDMASFYESLGEGSGLRANIESEGGTSEADLAARSTLLHADRITAPVLIIHGDADETVPVDQARRLAAALAARDHPVRLEVVEGAGHNVPFGARHAAVNPFLAELLGEKYGGGG